MFRALKEKVKHRLRYHLNRQLSRVMKDIEFARQFRAAQESAEFADQHMRMAKSYPDKFDLLEAAIDQMEIQGLCCEFGVYRGETLNFIASLVTAEVHGFDSFEGLPEDWKQGHEKGTFALEALPQVRPNVRLHQGWFEDTIPAFREQHPAEKVAFLHLDADIYSSTRTVFELLGNALVPGTVIAFDEFFNYPGWCEGNTKPSWSSAKSTRWKCAIWDSREKVNRWRRGSLGLPQFLGTLLPRRGKLRNLCDPESLTCNRAGSGGRAVRFADFLLPPPSALPRPPAPRVRPSRHPRQATELLSGVPRSSFSQTRNIQFLLPQNLKRVNHRELHVMREAGSGHAKNGPALLARAEEYQAERVRTFNVR